MVKEKEEMKRLSDNEAYIRRKVRNMLAMERKRILRFGNYAVEIPDIELAEGMGFEGELKIL